MTGMAKAPDRWHRWLMDGRFGGDPAARERLLTELLYPVRDTVLDQARLRPGDTVLDVGTGDGLIAFGALERLAPSGHVVFSDISQDLLDHCRAGPPRRGCLTGAASSWPRPIRWTASPTPPLTWSPPGLS